MIVRILRNTGGLHGLSYYYTDDVADVDEALAKRMLELGYGELVKVKPEPAPVMRRKPATKKGKA